MFVHTQTVCLLLNQDVLFSYRFMATNDLMSELQKDSIKLDDDSERKVVKMILKLLEDKNGEVQNLAVKWYWQDCAGRIVFLHATNIHENHVFLPINIYSGL